MDLHQKFTLCTLCLDPESKLLDVFQYNERGFKLSFVIQDLLQFKVTKQGRIPWMSCTKCIGKLKDFVSFRNNATKSINILRCLLFDKKHSRGNTWENGSRIAGEEDDGRVDEPGKNVSPGNLFESVKDEPDSLDSHGVESEIAVEEDNGHFDEPGENVSPGNLFELVKDEPDSLHSHGVESEIEVEEDNGHSYEPRENVSTGNLVKLVKDEPDSLDLHGVEPQGGDVFPKEGSSLSDGKSEEFTLYLESDSEEDGAGAEDVWCDASGAKLLKEEAGEESVHNGPAEGSPLVESSQSVVVSGSNQSQIGLDSEDDCHSSAGKCPRRSQRLMLCRSQPTVSCHVSMARGRRRSLRSYSATVECIGPSSKPQDCAAMGLDLVNKGSVQAVERGKKGDRLRLGGVAVLDTPRTRLRSKSVNASDRPRDKRIGILRGCKNKDLLAPGEIKESKVVQRHREGRTRKRKQTVALRNPSVDEDAEKKREKFKEYSQKYYALLSEEERKALHKRKYARRKQLLELMSPEKRKEYVSRIRSARKEYQRKYIASLSEEERTLIKKTTSGQKEGVALMSTEEREEHISRRRIFDREYHRRKYASLSEDERKAFLKKVASRRKEHLASMSTEKREEHISRRKIIDRERHRRKYASLSEDERKALYKRRTDRRKEHLASMSAEEREEQLEKKRYYYRKYSVNKKLD